MAKNPFLHKIAFFFWTLKKVIIFGLKLYLFFHVSGHSASSEIVRSTDNIEENIEFNIKDMKQFWEVATSPPINLISPTTSSPISSFPKSSQMSWKSMPNLAKVKIIFTKKVYLLIFAFRFDEKSLIFQFYVQGHGYPNQYC